MSIFDTVVSPRLSRDVVSPQPRRGLRAAALACVGFLAVGPWAGVASAQAPDQAPHGMSEFAACMAGSGSADLLVIMDQSASLVDSFNNQPATDPEHLRIEAASDFVRELSRWAGDYDVDLRVRTAGFGEGFYSDDTEYGGWNAIDEDPSAAVKELEKFRDRTADGYTQYPDALQGAFATAGTAESPCRAVMMFTDGTMTMANEDEAVAEERMCAADGPVAKLRETGTHLFTVGLSDGGSQDMTLLRDMAESNDACGSGATASGQFFEGASAAGLMAAFRSALPNGGGTGRGGIPAGEKFTFMLDNSVSPIRLSGLPEEKVEDGQLVPLLTAPDGTEVELTEGEQTVGDAKVTSTFNKNVPGMVDVEMDKTGDWSGEWTFGYRVKGAEDATYRAQLLIRPGLHLAVEGTEEGEALHRINTQPLKVALTDAEDRPVDLEGDANATVVYERTKGDPIVLTDKLAVGDGGYVEVPLDRIEEPTNGTVSIHADIATAGKDGKPGTKMEPITYQAPLSVTLENLPQLPGQIDAGKLTADTQVIDVSVAGPGKVWIESTSLDSAILPGDSTITLDAEAHDADSAVALERDTESTIPLTVNIANLADGPFNGTVTLGYSEDDGSNASTMEVPVYGTMAAPVDAVKFGAAAIGVLLAGLLIPLGILYIIKYLTSTMPSRPRVTVMKTTVTSEDGTLRRADTGGSFDLDHGEFLRMSGMNLSPRSANLAGVPVHVKLGADPTSVGYVVVDHPLSIADNGEQSGTSAKLPCAVHNHWFITMDPSNEDLASIVFIGDENLASEAMASIVSTINAQAPRLITDLRAQRIAVLNKQSASSSKGGPRLGRKAGASGADAAGAASAIGSAAANEDGGFGSSDGGFGSAEGGFGSAEGGFGAQGSAGFGSSDGGFGSSDGGFGSSDGGFGSQASGGFGSSDGGFGQSNGGFGGNSTPEGPQQSGDSEGFGGFGSGGFGSGGFGSEGFGSDNPKK
ncbi:vWA domain-containing protein [Corynebacterium phoceense]|uniref:vWA domain-containing protein n=1 Tax=Corynebacterium phoceense TaxID=1686286 RepID=UPI001D8A4642|nr:vWA domain-containing protein [Corynebacterium phoceense]HJG44256.1 VWA domain-containing protein [Corynebacterium phoceense]